jgi:hypothetical protein
VGVVARIEVGESADHNVVGQRAFHPVVSAAADPDPLASTTSGDRVDASAPDQDVAQRVGRQRVVCAL